MNVVLVEPARKGPGPLDDLLAAHPDLNVLARVASARDVPRALRELPTHVGLTALISLEIAGEKDALWLIRTIRQYFPSFRILAFGTTVGQVMIENAFFAGADGYLDMTADPARLAEAMLQDTRDIVLVESPVEESLGEVGTALLEPHFPPELPPEPPVAPEPAPERIPPPPEPVRPPEPPPEPVRPPEPPPMPPPEPIKPFEPIPPVGLLRPPAPPFRFSPQSRDGAAKRREKREREPVEFVEPADGAVLLSGIPKAPQKGSQPPRPHKRTEPSPPREASVRPSEVDRRSDEHEREESVGFVDPGDGAVLLPGPPRTARRGLIDRWRRGDREKRVGGPPSSLPKDEPRSETEPVTDDQERGPIATPEPKRGRRFEPAFQWEFPEPDRQPVSQTPRLSDRHRVEKRRRRPSAEERQPLREEIQSEPVPETEPEEKKQLSSEVESVPTAETGAPVEERPPQSDRLLEVWLEPTMQSEPAPDTEPLLRAEIPAEAAVEEPPAEPVPKQPSRKKPRAASGRRDRPEKRRRAAKKVRVDHEPEPESIGESIAQDLEAAPEPERMLEAEPKPAPEAPVEEPSPEAEPQESLQPKRRMGFGHRDRAKKQPSAGPAPKAKAKPEPVIQGPEPEAVPERLLPAGDEADFFERAGVGLVVVGMPFSHRDRAAEGLGVEPKRVRWLPSATAAEALLSDHRTSTFVLLLTPGIKREDAFGMAEYVARLDPATGVVLVGDRSDEGFLLAALRTGVREVVEPTAPVSELAQVLERVMDGSARIRSTRGTRLQEPAQGGGTIVSVFSSKGGTGKTFLAANLAAALSVQSGADTAVLDLDLSLGDIVSHFGAEPPLDFDGFASLSERNDRVAMRRTGLQVGDHLWAYATRPDSIPSSRLSGEAVAKTLRTLQRNFAYTVVDTAPDYDEQSLAALDLADVICLVAALDVVAVRHLSSAFKTLLSLGIPPSRFLVVLNRADSKVKLSRSDVERVLRFHADAMIPSSRLVPLSLNRGRPVYLDEPKSNVSRGIGALAERIRRLHPQVAEFPDAVLPDGPYRRGRFRKR